MTAGTPAGTSGPQVLIADDDPTIVLLLEHVLEALNRSYETADDGEEAWNAWERSQHDLVVLDVEMPKMDGLEVCRRIRAADTEKKTFILIVTGRDRAADLEAVLDAGADDYVTKPVTGQRLLARLKIAQRRMAAETARRDAEEELRKSRWLAGIGETTMALQHEINNPLTGLLATAELMMLDAKELGQPTKDLEVVIEQARRIVTLVKRMGELRDPKTVPYNKDSRMLDLGGGGNTE
jgi:DNA-binding response OmpR family regulator